MKLFLILQTQDDYIQGINKYTLPFEVVKDETKQEGKIQADLKGELFISSDCQHHSNFNYL